METPSPARPSSPAPSASASQPLLQPRGESAEQALTRVLLYFFIPAWTIAGTLDCLWHKQTDIEHTSGTEESLIHLLMFAEAGLPLYMGLLLEINAGVLAAMVAGVTLHAGTALWDVHYAEELREVTEREQHTHSFLEVLPFAGLAMAASLHWDQAQAMLGLGPSKPDFRLRPKQRKLPRGYLLGMVAASALAVALPYGNELFRCIRARRAPHYDGRPSKLLRAAS